MVVRKLIKNVYSVGAIDWDRRLFDELIPTPDGTSYNAYLVKGSEKIALIDAVDPEKAEELFGNLEKLGIKHIDYLITNHAEQDHSGSIPMLLEQFPGSVVVTNAKCKELNMQHLQIPEDKFMVVGDGDTLSLGDKTLQFIIAPWVHWPETMFTYLQEDGILFSCDFLGAHIAQSDLFVTDEHRFYEAAKRYFAEIMMPFRVQIRKHLTKLEGMDIKIVAPSHGPVNKNPGFIMDAYREWISPEVKNEVLIPFVSMHGSTRTMVDYLTAALVEHGITVKPFNLTVADLGEIAIALVDAATIVLGAPALLIGPHPVVANATYIVNALRPKTKFVSIVGSYGWGCQTAKRILEMTGNLKAEVLDPVIIKGHPKEEDFAALDRLAEDIRKKHESLKLLPPCEG